MLNGKVTEAFQLKQSLRQGCPLSPLLYLVVANALSMLLTQATDRRRIQGVYIQETGDQVTHGQFVDDTNIEETFAVFWKMGEVSWLHIKYTRVKFVLISDHPLPEGAQNCLDFMLAQRFHLI